MLRPRQFNFLAAFEAVHGQPDYVARQTLVEFCEQHEGKRGPFGYVLRWPAWLTYNQSSDRPYKSLLRGHFRMTAAWEEYNAWASQRNAATRTAASSSASCGEESFDHEPEQSGDEESLSVEEADQTRAWNAQEKAHEDHGNQRTECQEQQEP